MVDSNLRSLVSNINYSTIKPTHPYISALSQGVGEYFELQKFMIIIKVCIFTKFGMYMIFLHISSVRG